MNINLNLTNMKIRTLLTTLLVMFAAVATTAQVESGKVYRLVNKLYGTVASESAIRHTINCENKGTSTDYQQMWIITETATESLYTIQNVYTGRNLHFESGTNQPFYTVTDNGYALYINDNSKYFSGCYTISLTKNGNWAMHCASSGTCVPWNADSEGTNWTLELVSITEEDIAEARKSYEEFNSIVSNESTFAAAFEPFFEDKACTVLKAEYASMSDDELVAAMSEIPAELQQIALKVKNDSWNTEKREKEFRIYDYKPYSDPEVWHSILYTRLYSPLDNPTGICTFDGKSYVYVFVDEIPEGTRIELDECQGTYYFGTTTRLHEGLNIVPSNIADGHLFISYICETAIDGKKLEDYPAVKIHIENGYVNGFWSKERGHTNADWKYMQEYMFENESAVQAKGKYTLLDFRKKEFLNPGDQGGKGCPEKIEELIGLWDFWNETQQKIMDLPKYYSWFNNLQLAMSDDSGFMDAGNWRTHYNNNTLSTICNYDLLIADAGSTWGPNHEIGHNNQYVIEIVGTSEVSNNAFANMVTYYQGTHTSRGQNMSTCISSYEKKIPYVLRGESTYGSQLFSMTRMYFQLFLYAHAAGKCPDFYQQLHEKLRYDRLIGWGVGSWDEKDENGYYKNSVNGVNDHLKFAEACCEILQMDLSEFFEAWGFFFPYKNGFVGDYGHHWCFLDEEDAIASKKRMQQYEKKGGHLIFLEDRIRPYERLDGNGMRQSYANWEGESVGQVGKVGQWHDYIDESVKAQGYYFTSTNGKVIIKGDGNESGALGFKLYNADTNELLTFTNGVESMNNPDIIAAMTIPMASRGANLKVVAAQADGTDYIIPSAAEGPVEMQLEALEASLKKAKSILDKKTTGKEVGKYFESALVTLQEIYDAAKPAFDNKDTSVHSYAEWSSMLDEECSSILNDKNSRLTMKEGNIYYMYNRSKTAYYLTENSSIVGTKNTAAEGKYAEDARKQWTLEYSGTPGEFYMKSVTGKYLSYLELNNNAYAATSDPAQAVIIKVHYDDLGYTFFTRSDNDAIALGFNSSATGVGISPNEALGQWRVFLLTDNSAAYESEELTRLMQSAESILFEVCDVAAFEQGSETVLRGNIKPMETAFRDYVKTLYDAHQSVDMENVAEYENYIQSLRAALYNVEGKYSVTAPTIVSNDCNFYWYKIVSDVTGLIMNTNAAGRVMLTDDTDDVTDDMLWAAVPGKDGQLHLLNAGSETFMRQYAIGTKPQQSFSVSSNVADVPVTFEYDSNNDYTIIYTGDGSAAVDSGSSPYVARNAKGFTSGWHFELVSIENNEELHKALTSINEVIVEGEAAMGDNTYDLFGRKIQTPMKNNIYIKGNKKIIAE